jgi:hypothetical protein
MESLLALATRDGLREVGLPCGKTVSIRALQIRFPACPTGKLDPGVLKSTYTSKPLVMFGSEKLFGELAIVRWLEKDGWKAVWVDTFHGRKFWKAMPHKSSPVILPPLAKKRYEQTVTANGKPGGFFDVMAWKDDRVIHLEYKGAGDSSNQNEAKWIDAALSSGVAASDLFFVTV